MPSGGDTGVPVVGPDRDNEPDSAYSTGSVARHDDLGPVLPKSVTDNATSCGNRSAKASHEVPYDAAWPGIPLSTTMSALPASSINRWRSFGSDGSSTVARLFALCSAKRRLVPRRVGRLVRDGQPPGGSTFSTSAPRSASSRVTGSPF